MTGHLSQYISEYPSRQLNISKQFKFIRLNMADCLLLINSIERQVDFLASSVFSESRSI
jgi:hypothetical protein